MVRQSVKRGATAVLLALSLAPVFAQSNGPDTFRALTTASNHLYADEAAILQLHREWFIANAKAAEALDASSSALDAARKCSPDASRLADQANAKLGAARVAAVHTDTVSRSLVADAEKTVTSLALQNPNAVVYASFTDLQERQEELPREALLVRTGLDPGDDPISGVGLLTAARLNLKQAREALAHCTSGSGH